MKNKQRLQGNVATSIVLLSSSSSCRVGEMGSAFPVDGGFGFPEEELEKWDSAKYEALLNGGEQVTSVLKEMVKLVLDWSAALVIRIF